MTSLAASQPHSDVVKKNLARIAGCCRKFSHDFLSAAHTGTTLRLTSRHGWHRRFFLPIAESELSVDSPAVDRGPGARAVQSGSWGSRGPGSLIARSGNAAARWVRSRNDEHPAVTAAGRAAASRPLPSRASGIILPGMRTTMRPAWLSIVVLVAAIDAEAGRWEVGGRVGASQENGTVRATATVTADYAISDRLSWRTDVQTSWTGSDGGKVTDVAVPTHLLYHPFGRRGALSPYLGPAARWTMTVDFRHFLGADAVAGVTFPGQGGKRFGIEWRGGIPDAFGEREFRQEVALTGSWDFRF